jgi:uncharacterized protein YndB with AHSA1/START domain
MRTAILAALAMALLTGTAAQAAIVEQGEGRFTIRNVAQVKAPPAKVYQALGQIERWWNPSHSYSGQSANLSMPLQPGACFCEKLPGGGVAHGRVVMAWPEQGLVRVDAALGPLQEQGVTGVLTFKLTPKDGGTEIVQTYAVSGGRPTLPKQFAAPVDGVISEQFARLQRYIETGKPQ